MVSPQRTVVQRYSALHTHTCVAHPFFWPPIPEPSRHGRWWFVNHPWVQADRQHAKPQRDEPPAPSSARQWKQDTPTPKATGQPQTVLHC
mmetsp:Transcript_23573/g.37513  ORF Transcript_23573/g.37513 Transcript_23573/m.37513 type:complete len:90 (-) Transcript_23573:603-872(-)